MTRTQWAVFERRGAEMKPLRSLLIMMAALAIASLQACSAYRGPVIGVVVDQATGKPVADAIVVMRWHGNWTKIFGESSSACYHVETARTDAEGRYRIAAWTRAWSFSDLRFTSAGVDYHAYKPGYITIFKEGTIALPSRIVVAPFTGTKDEYFAQVLTSPAWGCAQAGPSRRSMRQFYVAAAREAAELAETRNQQRLASFLASEIDDPLDEELKRAK
ncbi:MAG: hypothetical protein V4787_04270 [Pseudomonadota bacterium]